MIHIQQSTKDAEDGTDSLHAYRIRWRTWKNLGPVTLIVLVSERAAAKREKNNYTLLWGGKLTRQ